MTQVVLHYAHTFEICVFGFQFQSDIIFSNPLSLTSSPHFNILSLNLRLINPHLISNPLTISLSPSLLSV